MSDILVFTNRALCREDFLCRMEKIAAEGPFGVVLREKDLSAEEYGLLAGEVMRICERKGVTCILHNFADVARTLGCTAVHLPLPVLRTLSESDRRYFSTLGASCHSPEDALEAERLGCTYITAGHVFDTDCKKGIPCRGLDFLREVCESVSIPVYAIGGISSDNISHVRDVGAKGACVMSGAMRCEDVKKYFDGFKEI